MYIFVVRHSDNLQRMQHSPRKEPENVPRYDWRGLYLAGHQHLYVFHGLCSTKL